MIFEQSKGPKADLPSNMKAKIFLDPYQSKYIILNIDHQYIKCYADKKYLSFWPSMQMGFNNN